MSIPVVLLASDDLNARARLDGAAGLEGRCEVRHTGPVGFAALLEGVDLLILDLDRGGRQALEELGEVGSPPEAVGFVSHVDTTLIRAARAAGCRPIPRGRFWAELPGLLPGD